jgi:hypothetical protein
VDIGIVLLEPWLPKNERILAECGDETREMGFVVSVD